MRGRALFSIGYAGIATASLLLRSAVPVFAIGPSPHDDLLFVRLAYRLGSGAWLGLYDHFTLIKGVGYPSFILAAFAAGIPLKMAEQVLYLVAAGLTAWLVWSLVKNRWLPFVLFACLAFNPVLWTAGMARVIREGMYIGLSLACVMLAALLVLSPQVLRSAWARVALLVAFGLLAGLYWLTRDEGPWLGPTLGVLALAGAVRLWRDHRSGVGTQQTFRSLSRIVGLAAIPAVVFAASLALVAGLNQRYYGVFTLTEIQGGPYLRAYGALSRIQPEQWVRHVPVSDDALQKAYSVSAAARELQPSLDGKLGEAWRQMGCQNSRRDPCPGFLAGWFMWLLREAVAATGHYSSAQEASAFYDRLAAEINAACDARRIACGAPGATLAPPFRWSYVGDALSVAPDFARLLGTFGHGRIGAPTSAGDEFTLGLFSDLVGPLSREPVSSVMLAGTASEGEAAVRLSVRDREGSPARTDLRIVRAPYPPREVGVATDFELTTDCVRPSCELVVGDGANERTFPIAGIGVGPLMTSDQIEVVVRQRFERGAASKFPVASEMRRDLLLRIARGIAVFYAAVMPVLSVAAALGVLIALALWRQSPWAPGLMALALACATAVLARIAMLAYLEAASFSSLNVLYLSPASPFLLTSVILGLYLGICALGSTRLALMWPRAQQVRSAVVPHGAISR